MTSVAGPSILLVEDDPEIRRWLRVILESEGYHLLFAESGERGVIEAAARRPELILLDLGLPDLDGVEVIRRIRGWSATPIIVISARGQEKDKVEALDAGADDYVSKPFGVGELLARLRVALRHASTVQGGSVPTSFTTGGLEVDLVARRVRVDGREVHLTPIEYKLLTALAQHPGRMLTHRQMLKQVWGSNFVEHHNYLRVHMSQLRRKIEAQPARPRYILTEPGAGYRLADES